MEIRAFRCDNWGRLRVIDEPWWIVVSSERELFYSVTVGPSFPEQWKHDTLFSGLYLPIARRVSG